jgi:hypothetical protein
MHCGVLWVVAGVMMSSPCDGEPTEVFGGEFAIADGISGLTIDIDADGVFDINFAYFGLSVNSIFGWDGIVRSGDGISDTRFGATLDENKRFVHPRFDAGDQIGSGEVNDSSSGALAYESFFDELSNGPWLDQEIGYIGFSFLGNNGTELHYGWAEVQVDNSNDTQEGFLVLYRIGYETEPGVPIAAGAPLGCSPADLTGDGVLNFFDVSAFLTAFLAGDTAADFTGDGQFNFFDVSAFLSAFNAGCP